MTQRRKRRKPPDTPFGKVVYDAGLTYEEVAEYLGVAGPVVSVCSREGFAQRHVEPLARLLGVEPSAIPASRGIGSLPIYPLSRLVRERGFTQEEVASRIGVNPGTISHYARFGVPQKHAEALARVLGVEPESIIVGGRKPTGLLDELLLRAGVTQHRLADTLGVTRQAVNGYARSGVPRHHVAAVAKFLGLDEDRIPRSRARGEP